MTYSCSLTNVSSNALYLRAEYSICASDYRRRVTYIARVIKPVNIINVERE